MLAELRLLLPESIQAVLEVRAVVQVARVLAVAVLEVRAMAAKLAVHLAVVAEPAGRRTAAVGNPQGRGKDR